jgi:hypothetical protein
LPQTSLQIHSASKNQAAISIKAGRNIATNKKLFPDNLSVNYKDNRQAFLIVKIIYEIKLDKLLINRINLMRLLAKDETKNQKIHKLAKVLV